MRSDLIIVLPAHFDENLSLLFFSVSLILPGSVFGGQVIPKLHYWLAFSLADTEWQEMLHGYRSTAHGRGAFT
jgi:hypothetical protein